MKKTLIESLLFAMTATIFIPGRVSHKTEFPGKNRCLWRFSSTSLGDLSFPPCWLSFWLFSTNSHVFWRGRGRVWLIYFERFGDELDPIQDFVHKGDTEEFVHWRRQVWTSSIRGKCYNSFINQIMWFVSRMSSEPSYYGFLLWPILSLITSLNFIFKSIV